MAVNPPDDLIATQRTSTTTWHGAAFIVEALLLLVFLAFALAVLMQLFGTAHSRGVEERALTHATMLATNTAEAFAAAPGADSLTASFDVDGNLLATTADEAAGDDVYVVTRTVTPEQTDGGTLFQALISVEKSGQTVYELETSRYMSNTAQGGDVA